jgi:PAS domain S-box-containing protein
MDGHAPAVDPFVLATLDALSAHIAIIDQTGDIIAVNRAWTQFAEANGRPTDNLGVGANYLEACDNAVGDSVARDVADGIRSLIAGDREDIALEYPCPAPTHRRWFRLHVVRAGLPGQFIVSHENITDRRLAAEGLQLRARLLQDIDTPVMLMSPDSTILEWNPAAEHLYGLSAADAVGRRWVTLNGRGPGRERQLRQLLQHGHTGGERDVARPDGSTARVVFHAIRVDDAAGQALGLVDIGFDITARAEAERQLRGARDFLRAVTHEMGEGFFTLDGNGRVTSLNRAGERLLGWKEEEVLGEVMHDLTHYRHPDGRPYPREECPIIKALSHFEPVRVGDDVFFRRDGRRVEVEYTSSPFVTEDGITGWVVVFSDISARKAEERRLTERVHRAELIGEIRDALAGDRMVLHAQPIIDLETRQAVQHELLIRMRDHAGVLVPPNEFLPVAEQAGLIRDVDRWVVRQAVKLAAAGDPVEVNLSAASLGDPGLFEEITHEIRSAGADPGLLVFELTETGILRDRGLAHRFMQRLHGFGCRVALDDFGTGYSGFSYVKHLPVSFLKIDIDFVRDLRTSEASQHVVRLVVDLARSFNLLTVAEGVEDVETLEYVASFGVDFAQGHGVGRPLPLPDVFPDGSGLTYPRT